MISGPKASYWWLFSPAVPFIFIPVPASDPQNISQVCLVNVQPRCMDVESSDRPASNTCVSEHPQLQLSFRSAGENLSLFLHPQNLARGNAHSRCFTCQWTETMEQMTQNLNLVLRATQLLRSTCFPSIPPSLDAGETPAPLNCWHFEGDPPTHFRGPQLLMSRRGLLAQVLWGRSWLRGVAPWPQLQAEEAFGGP